MRKTKRGPFFNETPCILVRLVLLCHSLLCNFFFEKT